MARKSREGTALKEQEEKLTVRELLRRSQRPLTLDSDGWLSADRQDMPAGVTAAEDMTALQAFDRYGPEALLHRLGVVRLKNGKTTKDY